MVGTVSDGTATGDRIDVYTALMKAQEVHGPLSGDNRFAVLAAVFSAVHNEFKALDLTKLRTTPLAFVQCGDRTVDRLVTQLLCTNLLGLRIQAVGPGQPANA